MARPQVYIATTSFFAGSQLIQEGTTVAAGHPLLRGRKHLFRPFAPDFDVELEAGLERATAAPGERRDTPARQRPDDGQAQGSGQG